MKKSFLGGIFNKNTLGKAGVIALSVSVMTLETASVTAYATRLRDDRTYANCYGSNCNSDELYYWRLVTSDTVPLYEYLSDGNSDSMFRLLLGFEEDGNRYYYQADWTRVVETFTICNDGKSVISATANREVKVGADEFITRGAVGSFFADYSRQNSNSESEKALRGKYRYHLYYPNEKDDAPENISGKPLQIYTTYGYFYNDWFIYDGEGKPCGYYGDEDEWDDSDNRLSYYTSKGRTVYSDFVMFNGGGDAVQSKTPFVFTDDLGLMFYHTDDAFSAKSPDYSFFNDPMNDDEFQWLVYVGEPLKGTVNLFADGEKTKNLGSDYIISSPTVIRKDELLVVEEGTVLYVDSVLFLNGNIENKGIIIVGNGGCILGIDVLSGQNQLKCIAGDLLVRPGGCVSVRALSAEQSTISLAGMLCVADNVTMKNGIFEGTNGKYFEQASVWGSSGVTVDPKTQKIIFTSSNTAMYTTANKTKVSFTDVQRHYEL